MLKKYVNDSLIGVGALKGAPCEVDSITKTDGTTTITLKWTDTTGTDHFDSFDVEDGVGVSGALIDENGDLYIVLTDGTRINCGKVNSQFTTLPSPSSTNVGTILQYVGTTTPQYTKGYFYECVLDGSTYKWRQKDVQPNNGGGSNGVVDGYYDSINDKFYEDSSYTIEITGQYNCIYVSIDTNKLYRFNGSGFVVVSGGGGNSIQVINLPPASASESGNIYQYIGVTNTDYINGCFYQCRIDSSTGIYEWKPISVEDPDTYETEPIDWNNW